MNRPALLAGGRGLLALDQPQRDVEEMLTKARVPTTTETAAEVGAAFQALVLATPGLDRLVSGVLLSAAAVRAMSAPPRVFTSGTVALGVRMAADPRGGTSDRDVATEIAEHAAAGVGVARWRTVVGPDTSPSEVAAAARAVARWAVTCQEHDVVPFPECTIRVPSRFGLDDSERLHAQALGALTSAFTDAGIDPATVLLGVRPVVPGGRSVATADDVAAATLRSMRRAGIADAAGVRVVLSAVGPVHHLAAHLVAMQWAAGGRTFGCCFGRSLLTAVAGVWRGRPERVAPAQRELHGRLSAAAALQRAVALETSRPA